MHLQLIASFKLMNRIALAVVTCVAALVSFAPPAAAKTADGKQKLVIIAGRPSHPPRMHEFRAGSLLLQKALANVPKLVVEVADNGWVKDEKTFDDADAVVTAAVAAGARLERPVRTEPYGKVGVVHDPWGYRWMINGPAA